MLGSGITKNEEGNGKSNALHGLIWARSACILPTGLVSRDPNTVLQSDIVELSFVDRQNRRPNLLDDDAVHLTPNMFKILRCRVGQSNRFQHGHV